MRPASAAGDPAWRAPSADGGRAAAPARADSARCVRRRWRTPRAPSAPPSSAADLERAEAALGVGQRAPQDRHDLLGASSGCEHVDLRAREQRGVHLERRVLRRGADEDDRAGLDVRQERVLLGLVEAVDLVDEQDGAAGRASAGARSAAAMTSLISLMPDVTALNAMKSAPATVASSRASRRLARAGRSPEDQGVQRAVVERLAQRPCRGRAGAAWPTNSSSVRGRIRSASGVPVAACGRRRETANGSCAGSSAVARRCRRVASQRTRRPWRRR